jgi:hypothetical protein
MTLRDPGLSTSDLREHLRLLRTEQRLALATPLARNEPYMADLQDELDATVAAYTMLAVIHIAQLRAIWRGQLRG